MCVCVCLPRGIFELCADFIWCECVSDNFLNLCVCESHSSKAVCVCVCVTHDTWVEVVRRPRAGATRARPGSGGGATRPVLM